MTTMRLKIATERHKTTQQRLQITTKTTKMTKKRLKLTRKRLKTTTQRNDYRDAKELTTNDTFLLPPEVLKPATALLKVRRFEVQT